MDIERGVFVRAVGVVLLLQAVIATYVSRQGGFFSDDILFMLLGKQEGYSYEYLTRSAYGHLTPAFLFLTQWYGSVFEMAYAPAVVLMVLLLLASSVAFVRLLVTLVGQNWFAVGGLAVYALGPVALWSVTWWSYSFTAFAGFVFGVAAMDSALRWNRGREARHLVATAVAHVISLTFWEKGFLTPVFVIGLLWVVVDRLETFDVRRWTARLPLLLVFAAASMPFLVVYVSGPYASEAGASPSITSIAQFLMLTVPEGAAPALLGFKYPYVGPTWLVPVVASSSLIAAVWVTLRVRSLVKLWLFVAIGIAVNQLLLGRARIGSLGVHLGRDLRYQLDNILLLIVGMVVALSVWWSERGVQASSSRRLPVTANVAWGGLGGLFMAATIWTTNGFWAPLGGRDAGRYFDNVVDSWAAADDDERVLLDAPVADAFMWVHSHPWNMWSRVAPLLDRDITVGTGGGPLVWVNDAGEVVDAHFVGGPYSRVGPSTGECISGVDGAVTFEPGQRTVDKSVRQFVRIGLDSRHRGVELLVSNADGTDVRGTALPVSVVEGQDDVWLYASNLVDGTLSVLVKGGSVDCVLGLQVGEVE